MAATSWSGWLRALARAFAAVPGWRRIVALFGGALGGALAGTAADAADLPEDQAEVMYHLYDGGGVTAQGPAVLLRKSLANTVSLSGSYYVDIVSNASIDVVTQMMPRPMTIQTTCFHQASCHLVSWVAE